MKKHIKQNFKLIFFILITSTSSIQGHDLFNGGCKNHCKDSIKPLIMKKKLNNISNKNQIDDNNSCLNKSLCRG